MAIKNTTKDLVIAGKHKMCNSLWGKARGLMFSPPRNLIFSYPDERRVSLHMFFVFFPIDVAFLNSNKEIVEIKENFKPFTVHSPKNKAKYVVELNHGTIEQTGTTVGDRLEF